MTVIRHAQRQHSTKRVNAVNSSMIIATNRTTSIEYLVVGGGGAGGSNGGGGGGAGGYITGNSTVTPFVTYSIIIGAGGASVAQPGDSGSNTSIVALSINALGGGGGAGRDAGGAGRDG